MADRAVLSTWEAGRYCSVSPYTIRTWVERGMLPAYATPGGHRRIRREDLDAFLEKYHMPSSQDLRDGGRRILLVEGDAALRRTVGRILRAVAPGLSVRAAPEPFSAGVLLHSFAPQLILFDLDDPRVSWREAVDTLRRVPGLGRVRAAGLSSVSTVALVEEAQRVGLVDVVAKPLTAETARGLIRLVFPYLRLPAARGRRSRTDV